MKKGGGEGTTLMLLLTLLVTTSAGADAPWQKVKLPAGGMDYTYTPRGRVFVQKPAGEPIGIVGVASYHFGCAITASSSTASAEEEKVHGRYSQSGSAGTYYLEGWIDYSAAPPYWLLSNGERPPERKPFTNISYDPEAREFRASVLWGPDVSFHGNELWQYCFSFNSNFTSIESGEFRGFAHVADVVPVSTIKFGDKLGDLTYVRYGDAGDAPCAGAGGGGGGGGGGDDGDGNHESTSYFVSPETKTFVDDEDYDGPNHADGRGGTRWLQTPPRRLIQPPEGIQAVLIDAFLGAPISGIENWFDTVYQKRWWHHAAAGSSTGAAREQDQYEDSNDDLNAYFSSRPAPKYSAEDPLAKRGTLPPDAVELAAILELFEVIPSDDSLLGAVEVRSERGKRLEVSATALRELVAEPAEAERRLGLGQSVMLKLDRLARCLDGPDPTAPPPALRGLRLLVGAAFGMTDPVGGTFSNLWLSGKDGVHSTGLHASPDDQFVIQLAGRKRWSICTPHSMVPGLEIPLEMFVGKDGTMSMSDTAALHALHLWSQQDIWEPAGATGSASNTNAPPPWQHYEEVYKRNTFAPDELSCHTLVLEARDRLYIPGGLLVRSTSIGSDMSAHVTVGLHKLGLTWADLIVSSSGPPRHDLPVSEPTPAEKANGDDGISMSKSAPVVNLWQRPPKGGWRVRSAIKVGQCTRGECANKLDELLFKSLRASAATGTVRAKTPQSFILNQMIPLWAILPFRKLINDNKNGLSADFLPTLEKSAFYEEFKWCLNNPLVAQLVGESREGTEVLEGDAQLLSMLLQKLKLPAALGMGMLQIESIPDFFVNEDECRQF